MSNVVKVVIGCPNKGVTDPAGLDNYLEMMLHLGGLEVASKLGIKELEHSGPNGTQKQIFDYPEDTQFDFFITTIPRVFPALAREKIAERAMDIEADYLFMFDDDMIMMPDLFERLYKHQKDIVAALAFSRLYPHTPVIYNLVEGYDAVAQKKYYTNLAVKTYPKDTLLECDAVGFGAVLIDMKVLKKMEKPWFMSTSGAGEDVNFCWKAHDLGFHIFSDTATKIGHLGERPTITEETYDADPETQKARDQIGTEDKYGNTK